ncbi:unnamed protein product, partial [Urochloa humidicola]
FLRRRSPPPAGSGTGLRHPTLPLVAAAGSSIGLRCPTPPPTDLPIGRRSQTLAPGSGASHCRKVLHQVLTLDFTAGLRQKLADSNARFRRQPLPASSPLPNSAALQLTFCAIDYLHLHFRLYVSARQLVWSCSCAVALHYFITKFLVQVHCKEATFQSSSSSSWLLGTVPAELPFSDSNSKFPWSVTLMVQGSMLEYCSIAIVYLH